MKRLPLPVQHFITLLAVQGLLVVALLLIGQLSGQMLLHEDNFRVFDANHYLEIQATGYRGVNIAFFPLAPYLWRALGLGIWGILLLHSLVYAVSGSILAALLKMDLRSLLLVCTLPSALFFFFPYSEPLFFAGSVLLLSGLIRDRLPLLLAGLLICTLARPAFTIFFPALLIMEFLRGPIREKEIIRILSYAGIFLVGVGVVGYAQWLDTGEWFRFFGVQKAWGNFLQIPTLPLRSWGHIQATLLDGAALVTGLAAASWLLVLLWRRLNGRKTNASPALTFSLSYLAGITAAVLLFRGGSLFSLNRFVFATPFLYVVVAQLVQNGNHRIKSLHLIGVFLGTSAFFCLFRSFVHLQILLIFCAVSLAFVAWAAMFHEKISLRRSGFVLALTIQFGYFVFSTYWLLTGRWIA